MAKNDVVDFDFESEEKDLGVEEPKLEHFVSNILDPLKIGRLNPSDAHGSLKVLNFTIKAHKDYSAGSSFSLCNIPQGLVRVLGALSRFSVNLSCKSAALGWSKFRRRDGEFTPLDLQGFGKLEKTEGVVSFLEHLPTQTLPFDSIEGVPVVCTAGSDGKKGDSIEGYLIYIKQ